MLTTKVLLQFLNTSLRHRYVHNNIQKSFILIQTFLKVMALIIQLPKPNLCGKSRQSSPDNQWEFGKDVSMQLVSRDPERYGEETAEEPIRNNFCIKFCCVSIRNIILAWGDNVFIHGRRLSKKYLSSSNSELLSPSDLGSFTNSASMSGFSLLWQNSYVGKLGFSSV